MRALISVSDKEGIVSFASELSQLGYEVISTGGTFKVLKDNGIKVIPIEAVTDYPEMLDGRVKTLHPKIHGGLLALRSNEAHIKTCKEYGIGYIDLVVVNLYPFEKTIKKETVMLEEAIENIDIGGPSMIRSGAKNYRSVGVIVNPKWYDRIIAELKQRNGALSLETKAELACEAFHHTARYDTVISGFLSKQFAVESQNDFPESLTPILHKVSDLRYGENPHQKAAFYRVSGQKGLPDLVQHHGKELSFNNIADLDAARSIALAFSEPLVTIIKHTNPCGTAIGETLSEAYQKAYEADPVSAFGSIIGCNRSVDIKTAQQISQTFVEAVIAPGFDDDALAYLMQKPSIRLIQLGARDKNDTALNFKQVEGGFLVQEDDRKAITKQDLQIVTKKNPTNKEINDLLFAFTLVKYVKSNAILIAKNGQSIGVGAGQMSRVEAAQIAIKKAGDKAKGAVMASDAFFPFKDTVLLAKEAGISSIIQPGGSKRDEESVEACDAFGLSMAYTGTRHFKH